MLIVLILAIIVILIILFRNPKEIMESSVTTQTAMTQATTTSAETTQPSETSQTAKTTETTQPPSIFQGSMTGVWTGQVDDEPPIDISGAFSVTIDEHGDISGTFDGDYSGTVAGHVDLQGNMECTGTASGGTTEDVTLWQGVMSVDGSTLSTSGDLSGEDMSGEFSGTGKTSR